MHYARQTPPVICIYGHLEPIGRNIISKRELQSRDIQSLIMHNGRRKKYGSKKVPSGFFYITPVWMDLSPGWAPWNGSPRP